MKTKELLAERGKTHGHFVEGSEYMQRMKHVMLTSRNWERFTYAQAEALEMVIHKLGRMLAGDPDCEDHARDAIGYLTLYLEDVQRRADYHGDKKVEAARD